MFRKILVPVDIAETEMARPAIDQACEFASQSGGEVRLLYVRSLMPVSFAEFIPPNFDEEQQIQAEAEMKAIAAGVALPRDRVSNWCGSARSIPRCWPRPRIGTPISSSSGRTGRAWQATCSAPTPRPSCAMRLARCWWCAVPPRRELSGTGAARGGRAFVPPALSRIIDLSAQAALRGCSSTEATFGRPAMEPALSRGMQSMFTHTTLPKMSSLRPRKLAGLKHGARCQ